MKNNNNMKSKTSVTKKGGDHLAIERELIRAAEKLSKQKQRQKSPKVKIDILDQGPQRKSRKSPTGASYNDGFDCVSKPERDVVRTEQFDELVQNLNGSVLFSTFALSLNPGLAATFPRLSKLVQLYEKYQFEQLEFYFLHDVSQFNSQGSGGLVILSALYDAKSAAPTTKQEVESSQPHVIGMPNQNILLRLNRKRLHPQDTPLYVRTGNLPGSTDIKTYDAGNVFVTVQGEAGAGEVGEIHVRGRVKLFGDILDASETNAPANLTTAWFQDTAAVTLANGVAKVMPMDQQITNGINMDNIVGVFQPPAGDYQWWVRASVEDSVNEPFSAEIIQKFNGVAQDTVPAEFAFSAVGAGEHCSLSAFGFKRFNGTDFLVIEVLCNGATGVLTAGAAIMWRSA
jgi:hypothetical protein